MLIRPLSQNHMHILVLGAIVLRMSRTLSCFVKSKHISIAQKDNWATLTSLCSWKRPISSCLMAPLLCCNSPELIQLDMAERNQTIPYNMGGRREEEGRSRGRSSSSPPSTNSIWTNWTGLGFWIIKLSHCKGSSGRRGTDSLMRWDDLIQQTHYLPKMFIYSTSSLPLSSLVQLAGVCWLSQLVSSQVNQPNRNSKQKIQSFHWFCLLF